MLTKPVIATLKSSSKMLTLGLALFLNFIGMASNSACQVQNCCVQDSECAENMRCVAGSCTPRCESDQQCSYGQSCDSKLQACVGGPYRNDCNWHFADEDASNAQLDAGTADRTANDLNAQDHFGQDLYQIDAAFVDTLQTDASTNPDTSTTDGPTPLPDASWQDAGNTDTDFPSCVDDSFEQNDDLSTASAIEQGQIQAQMCQADDDFYAFDVTQDQHLRLSLRFTSSVGDLDMALFNGSGNQVALSQGVEPFEEIELQAPRSERYSTRIYGYNQAAGPYTLDLCLDDEFEENDRMGRAPQIASGLYDLTLCSGDSDYFRLEVSPGANIVIQLNAASSDINYEQIKLYARGQSLVATAISASSDPNMLLLSYQVQNESVLFLAVEDAGQPSTNYQINVDLGD